MPDTCCAVIQPAAEFESLLKRVSPVFTNRGDMRAGTTCLSSGQRPSEASHDGEDVHLHVGAQQRASSVGFVAVLMWSCPAPSIMIMIRPSLVMIMTRVG